MKFVSVDIETTGLNELDSVILSVGISFHPDMETPLEEIWEQHTGELLIIPSGPFPTDLYCANLHSRLFADMAQAEEALRTNDVRDGWEPLLHKDAMKKINNRTKLFRKACFVGTAQEELGRWLLPLGTRNLAAKNGGSFDLRHLWRHFPDVMESIRFRHRVLDPGPMFAVPTDKEVPDLKECLKRAGLGKPTNHHSAAADAFDVLRLVRKGLICSRES